MSKDNITIQSPITEEVILPSAITKEKVISSGITTNLVLQSPIGVEDVVDNYFRMSINTALGTGDNFQLPLPSGEAYNFVVDWGDGNEDTITAYNQAETLHNYSSAFNGQISITGKCGGWSFNNLGDKLKITSVDNWGGVQFDFLVGGFFGCTNLSTLPVGAITGTTISVTNITSLFQQNTSLTGIPPGLFDNMTFLVTAANAFMNCFNVGFTSIPVDLFRFNNSIINFDFTFYGCNQLTSLPNNLFFYNSLVASYGSTFRNCRNMALPSVLFDTSNLSIVTTFVNFMRAGAPSFSNTGIIQDVWTYATIATSTNAFLNQTALTNYASIPNNWKGL